VRWRTHWRDQRAARGILRGARADPTQKSRRNAPRFLPASGRMDATLGNRRDSMPRLASEHAWHTPLLIVGAVLLLVAV
jgi:hypothetical protein